MQCILLEIEYSLDVPLQQIYDQAMQRKRKEEENERIKDEFLEIGYQMVIQKFHFVFCLSLR